MLSASGFLLLCAFNRISVIPPVKQFSRAKGQRNDNHCADQAQEGGIAEAGLALEILINLYIQIVTHRAFGSGGIKAQEADQVVLIGENGRYTNNQEGADRGGDIGENNFKELLQRRCTVQPSCFQHGRIHSVHRTGIHQHLRAKADPHGE